MQLFITLNVLSHFEEDLPDAPFEMDVIPEHIHRIVPDPQDEGISYVLLFEEQFWIKVQNNREWIKAQIEKYANNLFLGPDEPPRNPWDE